MPELRHVVNPDRFPTGAIPEKKIWPRELDGGGMDEFEKMMRRAFDDDGWETQPDELCEQLDALCQRYNIPVNRAVL
jgi:hypothetical protein